jgi:membrane protein required for colicin V production
MITIDLIFLAFLAFGFYSGFRNGLFVELASLVSFILGVWVAIKFSYLAGGWVSRNLNTGPDVTKGVAFIITLIAVVITVHLLAKTFTKIASFAFLGGINKLAGGLLSLLKTTLLLGFLIHFLQKMSLEESVISNEKKEASVMYQPIVKTAAFIIPTLNEWVELIKEEAEKIVD